MSNEAFDSVVIGAGVVGLAIARVMSISGMSVIVLEKEERSGEGISSRNSGVIHSGIYYPRGSLKAKFCLDGNRKLYDYCEEKGIDHKRLGKLIISTAKEESKKLDELFDRGISNGVNLKRLSDEEVSQIEPSLRCHSGIYSPDTGIIDVPDFITALEGDVLNHDGIISHRTEFLSSIRKKKYFQIKLKADQEFEVFSKNIINCSGLDSYEVSKAISGMRKEFVKKVFYAKGHYFKFTGTHNFNNLIYPIPEPGGLGIHSTLDIANQLKFGPNVEWIDSINYDFDTSQKKAFVESIKRYWPEIDSKLLQPDYTGIRPKIYNHGEEQADFLISTPQTHGLEGFWNLQGIESPGITSCLSIADYIYGLISSQNH
ncbi:NAD(P)/FAD-dependent oxidoreductase [Gammaproteobacteria bacterium]|nr:NAD(P)/FAD-dependent oxidoreductase [Gammaproteobacteria bacterium]